MRWTREVTEEHDAVTDWVRAAYADGGARVVGSATRTTGLALRVKLSSGAMWLRAGGVMLRNLEATEREGQVAAELRAAGVAVPLPRPRGNGAFAGTLAAGKREWPAIGYAELTGEEVLVPSLEQAEALGGLLRGLHEWAPSAAANGLPWVEPLQKVDERLHEAGHWLDAEQRRALQPIVSRASAIVSGAGLALCVCHGDVRLANVRFGRVGAADGGAPGLVAPALFDLEALGLGPALYDVACLWRRRMLETGFDEAPADWRAFRAGYEKRGALGDAAWSLVPALGCLRAFWTMMLPVEPALDWGETFRASREYWAGHLTQLIWFDAAMRDPSGWV
ncbi:MAG TPA: phosphotransferase [Polyangiaceae bacterium]|nr:phosphotransferase [Polyangiaceae bacterium]